MIWSVFEPLPEKGSYESLMDLVSKSVSQAVRRSTISFSQKQLIGVLSNFAWRKFWGKKTKTFFKIELFGNLQKFNLLTCLFVPPKWRITMFFIILRAGCSQFCLPFNQIVWFFDHQYLRKKSINMKILLCFGLYFRIFAAFSEI